MTKISRYRLAHGRRAYQAFIEDLCGGEPAPRDDWTDIGEDAQHAWVAAADAVVDAFAAQVDGADD